MDALEQYLSERYWSEDDLLREVRADIAERGPQIQVSAEAGRLLALLVRAAGATRVLEVGTLFGYSGIWMARELPAGGRLDTIEIEKLHADAAEHWFERAGLADRVTVHRGAGLDVLATLPGPYDVAFIDADKSTLPGVRAPLARAVAAWRHGHRRQRHPARANRGGGGLGGHGRHPRDARPAGLRPRVSCPRRCRWATGWPSRSRGAERRDDVPAIAPPDVRRAGGDPVCEVTRHIWGDPEAGEVADWIYASTEHVHALVFGLAPGTWFRHSPEFRTIFGADELLYVLRGTMLLANPETGEVLRVPRGGHAFFRSDTWHHVTRTATRSCACSSCTRRRPRPARRAPTRARSRTSSRPTGATATTRSSGTCREPSPRGGRSSSPPIVWRRSLDVLEGVYASTEHLTAGLLELNPGEISTSHTHGGDEVVYALEGVLHVRAFGEEGNSVFELNPDDAAYIPKGVAHEYRSYGSAPVRALFGVAPSYLP